MNEIARSRPATLTDGAVAILASPEPVSKVSASYRLVALWRSGEIEIGRAFPPPRPARPDRPSLRPPKEMPKRRNFGSPAGRIALLHALAHIELNAIDLSWDIIARFAGEALPRPFFDDWVGVACEETAHFELLTRRLADFGARYGDLPAHDGLWESAVGTADDLLDRLAVVPLVLEARGLDVTPEMAARLERVGDAQSAETLRQIYKDEIGHVTIGARWFDWLCRARGLYPGEAFGECVRRCFKGNLKPPFNRTARTAAGLPGEFYEPLAATTARHEH